jgi:hypothetical protein
LEYVEEIDKFVDIYDLPKLNQEDINNPNRFIMSNEIGAVIVSQQQQQQQQQKHHQNQVDSLLDSDGPLKEK